MSMDFETSVTSAGVTIAIRGHLASLQSALLCKKVEALRDSGAKRIVIDLGAVNHIESAGLGGLIFCRHVLNKAGVSLLLTGPTGHVRELLKEVSFEDMFDIND